MGKGAIKKTAHLNGNQVSKVEQSVLVDDSFLPAADELAKLKEVDPDVVPWVKERIEKEQDARIRFNESKLELADKDVCSHYRNNRMAMTYVFIIALCGLLLATFLVYLGNNVAGTVFGTVGMGSLIWAMRKQSTSDDGNKK